MERHKKDRKQGKKSPRVPIKTYKWEDVRRARKQGGYPWTYLYKQPYNEHIDPDQYTMESMRKSKSSSTLGKSTRDGVQIEEILNSADSRSFITDYESDDTTSVIITTDNERKSPHHSTTHKGSLTIQEQEDVEPTPKEVNVERNVEETLNLESAESSDNISQYLDEKDEKIIGATTSSNKDLLDIPGTVPSTKLEESTESTSDEDRGKNATRAQSEEPKKKRKLSIDSSYSRMSLSRLGLMKRFKEAKDKIKTLSTPNLLKIFSSKSNETQPDNGKSGKKLESESNSSKASDPKKAQDEVKTKNKRQEVKPPVYIHIPLKPPDGTEDEFSYLEFQNKENKPTSTTTTTTTTVTTTTTNNNNLNNEEITLPSVATATNPLITITDNNLQQPRPSIDSANEIVAIEIVKAETIDLDLDTADEGTSKDDLDADEHVDEEIFIIEKDPVNGHDDDVIIILSDSDKPTLSRSASKKLAKSLRRKRGKSAEPSERKRAKSAEPAERKRKSSIESSYSRISLSKLGLMKKLRDVKDMFKDIKLPKLSKSNLKKEDDGEEKPTDVQVKKPEAETKTEKKTSAKEPKYIHIPLKPPTGQTDEFSYLEFQPNIDQSPVATPAEAAPNSESTIKKDESKDEQSSIESPIQSNDGVQFIFLTPPSDDEILDDRPDVPETPTSLDSNKKFFGMVNRVEELKALAKGAVDKISPDKKLETVAEENSDKVKIVDEKTSEEEDNNNSNKLEIDDKLDPEVPEKMIVDEEDGLKLSASAIIAQQSLKPTTTTDDSQELKKSSLKSESSPLLKKKVSFKRRSAKGSKPKEEQNDGETAVVVQEPPLEEPPSIVESNETDDKKSKLVILGNSQSMSVDEEKTYLDQKLMKRASLEEDYNKWSKISDHEYEPINPPPDEKSSLTASPPTVHVTDTDNHHQESRPRLSTVSSLDRSTISLYNHILDGKQNVDDPSTYPQDTYIAQEMQSELEDRYFNRRTASSPNTTKIESTEFIGKGSGDQPAATKSDENVAKKDDNQCQGGPSKFQQAIQSQTLKLKTKLHGLKRPHLTLPHRRPKTKTAKPQKEQNVTTTTTTTTTTNKPVGSKWKFDKSKFPNFPKIPDTTRITLPTFSLPRRNNAAASSKRSLKERQLSTESNAGGSKKKFFDFSTYPRIFKKKPTTNKDDEDDDLDSTSSKQNDLPIFATVPRTAKQNKINDEGKSNKEITSQETSLRIPLQAQDSQNSQDNENDREDSVERRMASLIQYDDDIDDTDDAAFERENQEIHRTSPFSSENFNQRWNHGSFHPEPHQDHEFTVEQKNREYKVTDLDSPEDGPATPGSFDTSNKEQYSSESSLGIHRRGVLEEIDSDEFFLRQKGISQDNIEVGMYLSSEIREAFKSPINSLAQMQSSPPVKSSPSSELPHHAKRKSNKKSKRKKTPHVSQEQISYVDDEYDDESDDDDERGYFGNVGNKLPPARPKRRSKKNRNSYDQDVVPYQETIRVDESLGILGRSDDEPYRGMYENERMEGKEQPEIQISDPYKNIKYDMSDDEEDFDNSEPTAPPRKQRSSKSLSEPEDYNFDKQISSRMVEGGRDNRDDDEYMIPTPEGKPPSKPPRTQSRSSAESLNKKVDMVQEPKRPARPSRSHSRTASQLEDDDRTSHGAESLVSENRELPVAAVVEEPVCRQEICDYMGYAVVDKQKMRDPPLPPPRTLPRHSSSTPRRSVNSNQSSTSELRFFTVPRSVSNDGGDARPPVRPLRNYSTLGPSRPPRKKRHVPVNMTDEDKENIDDNMDEDIDITQYIEIEDEPNRDLHSGKVIEKMRDRPLPAPPRPPRNKSRTGTLQDDQSSIAMYGSNQSDIDKLLQGQNCMEEIEVSTQTEPLPDDFICDEVFQEESDTVLTPSSSQKNGNTVERVLITPTHYTHEETVTHASLIVEPLNGARILPDSQMTKTPSSNERIIPIHRDVDDDTMTSEVPEDFKRLKDPPVSQDSQILKAQRLQVADLDVDRLTVNELLASKIIVSEIDSNNIQVNDISSKSGTLKIGEIELPSSVIQQILDKISESRPQQQPEQQQEQSSSSTQNAQEQPEETLNETDSGEKKTPIDQVSVSSEMIDLIPQRPPRKTDDETPSSNTVVAELEFPHHQDVIDASSLNIIENNQQQQQQTDSLSSSNINEGNQPPERPPRLGGEKIIKASTTEDDDHDDHHNLLTEQHLDVDDEPPPRPPQPEIYHSLPSQPPPSFYALRAQEYALENLLRDDTSNIPTVPRRKRHHYHKSVAARSTSSEGDDNTSPVTQQSPPSRRRYRSPEPTIPELTGQLMQACGTAADGAIKRLIAHVTDNVLSNTDGRQDLHVTIVILLVLIAGLVLLGYGDGKTVHLHHWEYFNPPRDM